MEQSMEKSDPVDRTNNGGNGDDETANDYQRDIKVHLARRYVNKRERILMLIEDFIDDVTVSQSYELNEKICNNPPINRSIVDLLIHRRQLRQSKHTLMDDRYTENLASIMSVEKLNQLLHCLEDIYRDTADLIELNDKSGLAIKSPRYQTIEILLQIVLVLLDENNA